MSNLKNKPVIFGLYGEREFLLPDFIHCETIEYRSSKNNWSIKPHVHVNLFQIFVIEAGEIDFTIDGNRYIVNDASIVTIPENTSHALEIDEDTRGMVLTVSTSFLETFFNTSPNILLKLSSTKVLKDLQDPKLFDLITQMIYGLYDELHNELPEKGLVLQTYFSLLLCCIYRFALESSEKTSSLNMRSAQYFRAFQKSVKQLDSPKKAINEYAKELLITPTHLNRVCQSTVGKSASQVIQEHLLLEAEKYLKHTEYSISEIAYRLNFDDPAYFSRFFSKRTGTSPKQFRTKSKH